MTYERKPKRVRFIPVEGVTPIEPYPDAKEDDDKQQTVSHVSQWDVPPSAEHSITLVLVQALGGDLDHDWGSNR